MQGHKNTDTLNVKMMVIGCMSMEIEKKTEGTRWRRRTPKKNLVLDYAKDNIKSFGLSVRMIRIKMTNMGFMGLKMVKV